MSSILDGDLVSSLLQVIFTLSPAIVSDPALFSALSSSSDESGLQYDDRGCHVRQIDGTGVLCECKVKEHEQWLRKVYADLCGHDDSKALPEAVTLCNNSNSNSIKDSVRPLRVTLGDVYSAVLKALINLSHDCPPVVERICRHDEQSVVNCTGNPSGNLNLPTTTATTKPSYYASNKSKNQLYELVLTFTSSLDAYTALCSICSDQGVADIPQSGDIREVS